MPHATGASTVTSPATSKNAICVGATQTANYEVASSASHYVTYVATVTEGGNYSTSFRVLQVRRLKQAGAGQAGFMVC